MQMSFVDFQAETTKTLKNAINAFLDTQLKSDIPPYYGLDTVLVSASMTKIHISDFNVEKKRNLLSVLMPFWKESRVNV